MTPLPAGLPADSHVHSEFSWDTGGPDSAARVALASVIGYLAFLVGPPTLGFLGEEIGLRGALVVPLAVALLAAVLSPATATRRPTAEEQLGSVADMR